uniref:DNA binding protein VP4 n=1 Tax=Gokushovirinae environmental samples TaxID=1478972 RepID=A0A2R3UAA6_9VIRU|nr:DNA binding protein VP4 [Gokushovirinae environmental samples]
MVQVICAIYDQAVGAYGRPMFLRSDGEAIRMFQDEVNREVRDGMPNMMFDHPEHFSLWNLGKYDDASGQFVTPAQGAVELVKGVQVAKRPQV